MTLVHLLEATGRIQNLPELETQQSLESLRHLRPKSFWVLNGLFWAIWIVPPNRGVSDTTPPFLANLLLRISGGTNP